ncbi:MAG: septal ring lytic transglycosylase RlpA family protein [Ignavibacteria bacterium]|nr:septal ring lytic transglycosylase RlpA family protein [Ignavibacteria bacterium]
MIACSTAPRFSGSGSVRGQTAGGGSTGREAALETVPPPSGRVLLTLEGTASYYADDFHGKLTSNGETYDMHGITAAHRTFPFGTLVRVTHLESDKQVVVRINDRGPFVEGRMIDLSLGAAKEIGLIQKGTARVRLEVLQWGLGN